MVHISGPGIKKARWEHQAEQSLWNQLMLPYEKTNILLFLKVAFKPCAAVKFAAFCIVPINVPGTKVGTKFAKFNQVGNVPVFPGPWAFWPKKNYCRFDYFRHLLYFYSECKWLAVGSEVVCPAGSLRVEPAFFLKWQIIRFRVVIYCRLFYLMHIT